MTYEKIKSIVLFILIMISFFLTWTIWTFQPRYDTMEKSNYVQSVAISEQRDAKKIVKPDRVLFHYKDVDYGTTENTYIDKMIRELGRLNFFNFKEITGQVDGFLSFVHDKGSMEIIFPDVVPISLYKSVINIEDKNLLDFEFDRIVIHFDNPKKGDGIIYFVSYQDQRVFQCQVSANMLNTFERTFVTSEITKFPVYEGKQISDRRMIFFQQQPIKMSIYKYYPNYYDPHLFKQALFSDSSVVQRSKGSPDEEEFTNWTSILNIDIKDKMIYFVNLAKEVNHTIRSEDILQESINKINEHSGWTDSYRYAGLDKNSQKVTFRLYDQRGYPIFNSTGWSEIVEVWGNDQVKRYNRPYFSLEVPLTSEMEEITLPSGDQVLDLLRHKQGIKLELLQDVVVGYTMKADPKEPKLIMLEPGWFYKYDHVWNKIDLSDIGGKRSGLE